MNCAPIIIPTLNRADHLSRLLNSLKCNKLACHTDVYIALDYPPSELYDAGYRKVCGLLSEDYSCFRSFNVIKHSVNFGYLKNVEFLINTILEQYDRFIYMDDDLELSANFLEYMNTCLDIYEPSKDVLAVCGYSYPVNWEVNPNATAYKENFICPMWGTGFWRDKYKEIIKHISLDALLLKDPKYMIFNRLLRSMSDSCRCEYVDLCLSPNAPDTLASKFTDISMRIYLAVQDKYVISPTLSKVRNWGFDGTGEFCPSMKHKVSGNTSSTYLYHTQPIDSDDKYFHNEDLLFQIEVNKRKLNDFDLVPLSAKIKMYVKLTLCAILGITLYHSTTLLLRRLRLR